MIQRLLSLIRWCVSLSLVHEAVLQHHLHGALRQADGGQLPHSAVVSLCVHVPTWRLLRLSDGGPSGQQAREVMLRVDGSHSIKRRFVWLMWLCYRKGTLLFNNIFSIVPAVMMGVSEIAKSYEIIIVARIIVGICAGQICSTMSYDVRFYHDFYSGIL